MFQLTNKIALITGGGRGLGHAIALAFADAGADVAVASRSREQIEQVVTLVHAKGRRAFAVEVDVRNSESVARMVEATRAEFGRIDILVNSAGVTYVSRLTETTDDVWKWIIETNLNGTFYCCREVAKVMAEQKQGSIINLASVGSMKGIPGLAAYTASKGGVMQLTRTLALEMTKHNVRVNAIAPGYVRTDMNAAAFDDPAIGPRMVKRIPMRRVGQPEEIGPLAVYLASDEASYATGEIFFISGGEMAQ